MDTALSSITPLTMKQYEGTFNLWWKYCKRTKTSLFGAQISETISFLQDILVSKKCSYGTMNSHRSALSLILLNNISDDIRIKRFMRGISKICPAKPRYDTTWDPQVVLKYIEETSKMKEVSLKSQSQNLATLLALITGHRVQTLAAIRLSNITEMPSGFQIPITDTIKTTGRLKTQPCLHIPYYEDNTSICVARWLRRYLESTKNIRQADNDYLFVTYKKPHSRASKQSVSRWIKETLHAAGVNTDHFKTHSTRHASTSAAFRQGLSLDVIRQTAGWSDHSSCFARFYNRPIDSKRDFAKTILDSNNRH